ncbi:ABC transporter substrate-binding protein [Nocardioides limicola]|uniref:ABC transporter substrate-binding protein n=1 Tax=Nocardioides limicola TaxID=2803368 RepID=UPI00193B8CBB|nr:ABC transporter substrate-binding protein [Nocardioides sp. DJM-14]
MNRRHTWVKAIAGSAALALALTACAEDADEPDATPDPTAEETPVEDDFLDAQCAADASSDSVLKVAGILPLTGSLAFLGPPEVAGVGLAVNDIQAAGGVAGTEACYVMLDSGDADDASVSNASAQAAINGNASVVIGAAASSVTRLIIDAITSEPIVQISPANTAADFSGYSPFYFRTAPPDGIQGAALGNLLVEEGNLRVAFIVFNDVYGTGLRDVVQGVIEESGGEVVFGAAGAGQEFAPGQTVFSTEVSGARATNPDAIVVLAFDETKSIVPELANQGWDMERAYFTDGNTTSYADDFDPGTLEGAKGTIPGADPSGGFKDRVNGWYEQVEGDTLDSYSYAAESYDAVILAALAAHQGGSTDPETIQANLHSVSGADGGTECLTYADCVALIDAGETINYTGPSGSGPFDDENDPSSAFVGIWEWDGNNEIAIVGQVEGAK